ncbi:MAG: methylenetetrahydrofolate reductase C-terminal domain-containing protein [Actinomycetota bacterium]|nr:methylenetetrahydrofolate reductase C-terminal domain-containing protein [Actinomycetota bacterium]
MIVAEPKKLEEIKQMTDKFDRILMVGCGTCTTVCLTGGEREVNLMATALRLARKVEGRDVEIGEQTILRQCDFEYIDELKDVHNYQAIVSLACGAGIQGIARKFPEMPVLPGVNTKFIGFNEEFGYYTEQCKACGDCILHLTGGICPIARCAKGLLNGPCGGTNNGKCEIGSDKDCAWTLIYNQLERQGNLKQFKEIIAAKDFAKAGNIRSMDLRKAGD